MRSEDDCIAVALQRASFGEKEREAVRYRGLTASVFRYDTGIEAVRLSNARGFVIVLPYLGQMVWSAEFDGVELAMQSMFRAPRPAKIIVETYGCLAYHAGLLRNGVPSPADTHVLHGEMPCAEMDEAGIACGSDDRGPWIAVTGAREYAMGFGAHYRATPRVVLSFGRAGCDIVMEVENLSAAPMDLMYLCHVNFAFAEGGADRAAGSLHPGSRRDPHGHSRPCHADPGISRLARRSGRKPRADALAQRARAL